MAKYCMFCGEEIPEKAQFCPSCGQKQATIQKNENTSSVQNNKYVIEEDDDEMDLLLKYGMMMTPSKPKQEPQKIITLDYKPDIEEISEPEENPTSDYPLEVPIKEEKQTFEIPEPIKKEEVIEEVIEEVSLTTSESTSIQEEPIEETYEENFDDFDYSVADESSEDNTSNENLEKLNTAEESDTEKDEDWFYTDFDDFEYAASDTQEESPAEEIDNENSEESEQLGQSKEVLEQTPLNRHAAKRREMSIRRRSLSIDDEEESFSTSLSENNTSTIIESTKLLADEQADYEKRKKIKIEDEDPDAALDDRSNLEGRKQQTQKIEKRRKSQRVYNENKHYKIEQDTSEIDENDDPTYDGYYENVLPIDHDQERNKNFNLKTIVLVFLMLIGCAGLLYFLINFMF